VRDEKKGWDRGMDMGMGVEVGGQGLFFSFLFSFFVG
jgi:hypothetical protein